MGVIKLFYCLIIKQFQLVFDLVVKTNDMELNQLLQKPEDMVKFQKAIDTLNTTCPTKEIIINGKKIIISI